MRAVTTKEFTVWPRVRFSVNTGHREWVSYPSNTARQAFLFSSLRFTRNDSPHCRDLSVHDEICHYQIRRMRVIHSGLASVAFVRPEQLCDTGDMIDQVRHET